MKSLILCETLYEDIEVLFSSVSTLEYSESLYGEEIKDFSFIPNELNEIFNSMLNEELEIQPDTGKFLKPKECVRIEPFYQHATWLCIVALENTNITIHSQKNIKTFFDIPGNIEEFILSNLELENWDTDTTLTIKKNDFIFIRPWKFHSLQKNKLIQLFLLNRKLV